MLTALETADQNIHTLQAGVRYIRRMVLQGDEQTRQGELFFQQAPAPEGTRANRVFAVHFDHLIVGRRRETDRQDWVFNGEWLIERRPDEKQYVARQVAPPGEHIDPLRLGEGPLPIPIGQRAADVLSRYEAELVNPHMGLEEEGGSIHEFVADTWQLRLTPRTVGKPEGAPEDEGSADEFREIRLWYDRVTLLPRLARTINRSGDEAFVQLINLRVNDAIRGETFDIEPPPESERGAGGWEVEIKEYRGS